MVSSISYVYILVIYLLILTDFCILFIIVIYFVNLLIIIAFNTVNYAYSC